MVEDDWDSSEAVEFEMWIPGLDAILDRVLTGEAPGEGWARLCFEDELDESFGLSRPSHGIPSAGDPAWNDTLDRMLPAPRLVTLSSRRAPPPIEGVPDGAFLLLLRLRLPPLEPVPPPRLDAATASAALATLAAAALISSNEPGIRACRRRFVDGGCAEGEDDVVPAWVACWIEAESSRGEDEVDEMSDRRVRS